MKQKLQQMFDVFLDASEGFGVGLVDHHGLRIHSAGEHHGHQIDHLMAHLVSQYRTNHGNLEHFSHDSFDEQVLVGTEVGYYMLRLCEGRFVLYAFAPKIVAGGRVRYALHETAKQLSPLLEGRGLLVAFSQRLEQPRQFHGHSLVR